MGYITRDDLSVRYCMKPRAQLRPALINLGLLGEIGEVTSKAMEERYCLKNKDAEGCTIYLWDEIKVGQLLSGLGYIRLSDEETKKAKELNAVAKAAKKELKRMNTPASEKQVEYLRKGYEKLGIDFDEDILLNKTMAEKQIDNMREKLDCSDKQLEYIGILMNVARNQYAKIEGKGHSFEMIKQPSLVKAGEIIVALKDYQPTKCRRTMQIAKKMTGQQAELIALYYDFPILKEWDYFYQQKRAGTKRKKH